MNLAANRGMALITALLVVALVTTAVVTMTSRQQLDIRRTAHLLRADQIALYLQGIEGWAAEILRRDRQEGEVDHLDEGWATLLPPLPVEHGQLLGSLEELNGRFNLNNLRLAEGGSDEAAVARLRRLLQLLELDPDLANAIADWVDDDSEPRIPAGAEDDRYLGFTPPYRAANRRFADSSELRLIAGLDPEGVERLLPLVTVLPGRSALNINTAPALLLATLAPDLTLAQGESLVGARSEAGYASLDAFLALPELAGRAVEAEAIALASDHFVLLSEVTFGELTQRYRSLLQRAASGACRVVRRAQITG